MNRAVRAALADSYNQATGNVHDDSSPSRTHSNIALDSMDEASSRQKREERGEEENYYGEVVDDLVESYTDAYNRVKINFIK